MVKSRASRRRAAAPKRGAVPPARLTRERIVAAGLELLATRGPEALSMRTLGDALGAAPMSLYRHVRGKDELLGAIVAAVLERLDLDLPAGGLWSARVAAWMHSLRRQLLASPKVVSILMQHGHYAPALLRATNRLLAILREAGFGRPAAVRACREIMWSTLGFVSAEIRGPMFSPSFYLHGLSAAERGATDSLRPEDVAEVAAHMPYLLRRDLDDVFGAIVRHLLAGLDTERGVVAIAPQAARRRRRA